MIEICSAPRCRREPDLVVEDRPLCTKHHEARLEQKYESFIKREREVVE